MNIENHIPAPTYHSPHDLSEASKNFYKLMSARRSIRSFSSRPVDRQVLLNAIHTAGTAPSGANCQPWFFALIQSQDIKNKIKSEAEKVEELFYSEKASEQWLNDLFPLGTNAKKSYLGIAPALIAVFSKQNQSQESSLDKKTAQRNYYPLESTGIAVGLLLSALHQLGLATLTHTPKPMFFLNEVLGLEHALKPFILIVVGYPEVTALVPNIQRKPLDKICKVF